MQDLATSPKQCRRDQIEHALQNIEDTSGQGDLVFTSVYQESARLTADYADATTRLGIGCHPLAGVPISIKDLFDVKGEPTLAGSVVLDDARLAQEDAAVVSRLRAVGAAIIGKTNMTEFAFSGLGINPHYGTPLNVWDRANARIPGGSSSGAAISIVDGMAVAAIGTDTGGSCRIPAALNGIVGMKPTASSVPLNGSLPLSSSYDSIGPLASNVATCAQVYSVLSASHPPSEDRPTTTHIRLGVITNYVVEELDRDVARAYEKSIAQLAESGIHVQEVNLPVLDELPFLFTNGGLVAAEAYHWHRELLSAQEDRYDPRVAARIRRGEQISAAAYIEILHRRERLIQQWTRAVASFDAMLMPTVPIVAPRISDLRDESEYNRVNLLMLRNPTVVNALNGCAVSVPCHQDGEAPVGLSIVGAAGNDWHVLAIARVAESVLESK